MDIKSAAENYKISMQNRKAILERELEDAVRNAVENGYCITYMDYMDEDMIQEIRKKGYTVTENTDYKKNDDFRYMISWNKPDSR